MTRKKVSKAQMTLGSPVAGNSTSDGCTVFVIFLCVGVRCIPMQRFKKKCEFVFFGSIPFVTF